MTLGSICLAFLILPQSGTNDTLVEDFAVIVSRENSVKELSKLELERIFRKEKQFWEGGGKIVLELPKSGSDAKDVLLTELYRMEEDELRRYWIGLVYQNKISEPPKVLASCAVAVAVVSKTNGAVAVVDPAAIKPESRVRIVRIDGRMPGEEGYLLHRKAKVQVDSPAERSELSAQPAVSTMDGIPVESAATSSQGSGQPSADLHERLLGLETRLVELESNAPDGSYTR